MPQDQELNSNLDPQKVLSKQQHFSNINIKKLIFYITAAFTVCLSISEVVWGLSTTNTALVVSGTAGLATTLPALALVVTNVQE